ncbi:hypothetical protein K3725_04490 [Leisingera sp. S132]|uniref:hypothetical protein n=1 Tax=Leisingera sp. S132 TaxID=2867016 RepID=UPI0021A5ADF2|nr:hypothetical protein [Leisingera sp. S132]UWQ80278.1 hypothetical protein K3725_04490 [Leisingera sp. S132]
MPKLFTRVCLMAALAWPSLSVAENYSPFSSPQFGGFTTKIDEKFVLAGLCTVSAGKTAGVVARLEDIADKIPYGTVLARLIKKAPLEEGEALCGLKHARGGKWYSLRGAKTDGFALTVRSYKDLKPIVSVSPERFCDRGWVNTFSFCYENINSKEADGAKADGVTACVETIRPSDSKRVSFVLHAGKVAPDVSAQTGSEAENLKELACDQRTF